jgi:hypothetical protein
VHRDIPAVVRSKALAAGATQWIHDLPDLVASLEQDWSITVGRASWSGCRQGFCVPKSGFSPTDARCSPSLIA